jgi:hypothetical protein
VCKHGNPVVRASFKHTASSQMFSTDPKKGRRGFNEGVTLRFVLKPLTDACACKQVVHISLNTVVTKEVAPMEMVEK